MTALPAFAVEKTDVLTTYADIAAAKYADSLTTAQMLQLAVASLIAAPSAKAMAAARAAYLAARGPYMQTEVYRFGNPIVDDWEGRVNAWPLWGTTIAMAVSPHLSWGTPITATSRTPG